MVIVTCVCESQKYSLADAGQSQGIYHLLYVEAFNLILNRLGSVHSCFKMFLYSRKRKLI